MLAWTQLLAGKTSRKSFTPDFYLVGKKSYSDGDLNKLVFFGPRVYHDFHLQKKAIKFVSIARIFVRTESAIFSRTKF